MPVPVPVPDVSNKPKGKVAIVASNSKLAGKAEVEERRRLWAAALEALKAQPLVTS